MEPLVVTIPHELGKEEALRRVRPALAKESTSFPVLKVEEETWSGACKLLSTNWPSHSGAMLSSTSTDTAPAAPTATAVGRR